MNCLTSTQLRALSAAAGVVGRPQLRAGLLLSLTVACGSVDPSDSAESAASDDPSTSSASTTLAASTSEALTSGADGSADASTSLASSSSSTASTSSTTDDDLTTGATLLTDATTTTASSSTSGTDTGDLTTGGDSTGGLDDCFLDPETLEVDWACCEQQNWMPQPQCTPWGPPAPPAASRDLLARARAARLELA